MQEGPFSWEESHRDRNLEVSEEKSDNDPEYDYEIVIDFEVSSEVIV